MINCVIQRGYCYGPQNSLRLLAPCFHALAQNVWSQTTLLRADYNLQVKPRSTTNALKNVTSIRAKGKTVNLNYCRRDLDLWPHNVDLFIFNHFKWLNILTRNEPCLCVSLSVCVCVCVCVCLSIQANNFHNCRSILMKLGPHDYK